MCRQKFYHCLWNQTEVVICDRPSTISKHRQYHDPPLEGDDVPRVGIFVMLQYAAGGDLIHRLKAAAGSTTIFPWIDRIQCALDIAEGMKYIHSQGFLHRDLKSLNVLKKKRKGRKTATKPKACEPIVSTSDQIKIWKEAGLKEDLRVQELLISLRKKSSYLQNEQNKLLTQGLGEKEQEN